MRGHSSIRNKSYKNVCSNYKGIISGHNWLQLVIQHHLRRCNPIVRSWYVFPCVYISAHILKCVQSLISTVIEQLAICGPQKVRFPETSRRIKVYRSDEAPDISNLYVHKILLSNLRRSSE